MEEKKPHEQMAVAMRAQQDLHPRKSFMTSEGGYNPAGEHCCLQYLNMLVTVLARSEDTGGAYGLVTAKCPQGAGPPPHIHSREDEGFLVMEGRINIWIGDEFYDVGAGSFVFLPRGIMHRFEAVGPGITTLACIVSPGGQENMFRVIGKPTTLASVPGPLVGGFPLEQQKEAGRAVGVEFYPEHWGWIEQAKRRFGGPEAD